MAERRGLSLSTRSAGRDPELTVWNAMCRLEQMRQQRRGAVAAPGPRSHDELLNAE